MKFNRICKIVMLVAIAAVGLPRADSTENNDGSKTVKLLVREVPINVLGRTVPAKSEMKGMGMSQPDKTLVVQRWDPVSNRLVSRQISGPPPDIDVKYDALLANRRTLEGPEVFAFAANCRFFGD